MNDIILVDANDKETGTGEKLYVHEQGLLHRAFSVCVVKRGTEGALELLLQKRHPEKYHSGGLWSNTCCGHPSPGEDTRQAAERRLFEEMGIRLPLKEFGTFMYKKSVGNNLVEHEVDHVFIGFAEVSMSLRPHPLEVTECQWMPLGDLKKALTLTPNLYTAWLPAVIEFLPTE